MVLLFLGLLLIQAIILINCQHQDFEDGKISTIGRWMWWQDWEQLVEDEKV